MINDSERDLWADVLASGWMQKKCKDDVYAQNLYAAMCNMRFVPDDIFDILKDSYWSVSWRTAGGLVASIRPEKNEDYMDYYCSGAFDSQIGNVSEGVVTDEISDDLTKLGWYPKPWEDSDYI